MINSDGSKYRLARKAKKRADKRNMKFWFQVTSGRGYYKQVKAALLEYAKLTNSFLYDYND